MLLKHVFHISVKEPHHYCFETLRINSRNKRSLTSPLLADSQSKMLSKCLQLYLKYLTQNFITNTKSPRIAGKYCSYRIGSSIPTKKIPTFEDTPWTSFPPTHQNWQKQTKKEVTTCSEDKDERWVLATETKKCITENDKQKIIF